MRFRIRYFLRAESRSNLPKKSFFTNAADNGFTVGTYEDLIPTADLVCNLTPDKQHTAVVTAIMPLMKKGSTLSYSHGFILWKKECKFVKTLLLLCVPKSEVRRSIKRFWVPTLIAVHPENDPNGTVLNKQKPMP
jgi:ketol-acid reductoisomerase